jgi:hypothetical protein
LRVADISRKPSVPSIAFFFRLKKSLSTLMLINALSFASRQRTSARKRLYDEFRQGQIKILVVSKVVNFAVDLPDASVMIRSQVHLVRARRKRSDWGAFFDPKIEHLISIRWCRRGLLRQQSFS